jgi:hypothetical protein
MVILVRWEAALTPLHGNHLNALQSSHCNHTIAFHHMHPVRSSHISPAAHGHRGALDMLDRKSLIDAKRLTHLACGSRSGA